MSKFSAQLSVIDDPMRISVAAEDSAKTERLLKNGRYLALRGLWCVNGVEEFNPAGFADFFVGSVVSMTLLGERCRCIHLDQHIAKLEDGLTEIQKAKVRRT